MVRGGDSGSKGHGFESQHPILDGHFSNLFVVKIVVFVLKDENKLKRGWVRPIFKKVRFWSCFIDGSELL